jgi:NAD-dependent dihydropyrimidine dehydrogenase PreA subunit
VLGFETVRWTKFAVLVDAGPCTGCSLCEVRCPFNAITMRPAAQVQVHGV